MRFRDFWVPTAVVGVMAFAISIADAADNVVLVPDQDVAGFHFSAMQLNYAVPSLVCVLTGASGVTATVNVTVLLFEKTDSPYPYASVNGATPVSSGQRAACNVNNGQQSYPQIAPKKIELQVMVTNASTAQNVPVILNR